MTSEPQTALREDARRCTGHLRLCLGERNWQGTQGNWAGAGVGSSIDFQDHRPYLPGDDPRYIDWAAYARSGQTIMKLYREEVSPRLDLVVDGSRSMFFTEAKAAQTLRLFFFCVESAASLGASLRIFWMDGAQSEPLTPEQVLHPAWQPPVQNAPDEKPALEQIPFRPQALRLLISDLLFDLTPEALLSFLSAGKGRGMILAPYLAQEENPNWNGNMELLDCETRRSRRQRVDPGLLERYRQAYARHLASWQDSSRRYRVRLARVPCERDLARALEQESLTQGVVETWG